VYRLTTIVPGAAAGRAPHLCVRVQVTGKADVFTELFFSGSAVECARSALQAQPRHDDHFERPRPVGAVRHLLDI
jgi:protocatechuate 3,4-dioxygenase beta subunit